MSDATEEPTPRRLRKAQEEGDVPTSAFATQAVAFACSLALAPAGVLALGHRASADLRAAIARASEAAPLAEVDAGKAALAVVGLAAPMLAAAAASATFIAVIQSGGMIALQRLAPRLVRLAPARGAQQLVSLGRLASVVRALLFAGTVAALAIASLERHAAEIAHASQPEDAARVAGLVALELAKRGAVVGLLLAALDLAVTRAAYRRRLRMTKHEVARERRESEGDPHLEEARERVRRELVNASSAAPLDAVETATVIVRGRTQLACALRYDEDATPVVVASGHGEVAARILATAHANAVPIVESERVARAVLPLEIGAEIPVDLYEPVAEILRDAWSARGSGP